MRTSYAQYLNKHVKIKLEGACHEESVVEGDVLEIIRDTDEDMLVVYQASHATRLVPIKGNKITVCADSYVYDSYDKPLDDDKDRIERIINKLQEVWRVHDEMRFGQIIYELLSLTRSDGFYVSDQKIEKCLERLKEML